MAAEIAWRLSQLSSFRRRLESENRAERKRTRKNTRGDERGESATLN